MPRETVFVRPSTRKGKKWSATLPDGKSIHFGQRGAEDFTIHKDPQRMLSYLFRHGGVDSEELQHLRSLPPSKITSALRTKADSDKEDWRDVTTPGFWSRWLLWSEPSLTSAGKRVESVSNLKVVFLE